MGSLTSRQEGTTEELDTEHVHSYKYPPKSGNYFGTHFIMGGEKFDTPQPEAYLFGENSDLNFLSSKPAQCPYALSAPNEPSKTLKSVINIRKDSLRLVRAPSEGGAGGDLPANQQRFNIEFTFDSDVRCSITVHYFCTEEITRSGIVYRPRDPAMSSETYRFKCGAAQTFSQPEHTVQPGLYGDSELAYNADTELYPVVVVCTAEEGDEPRQSHVTTGIVDRLSDGSYMLKPLKQKQFIDGLVFLLQEIYGIENKLVDNKCGADDETEDSGAECVICMSDLRDTLILPCRHLCVCNCCADHLRYQANNCPICRAPFRALLQLRAVQRSPPGAPPPTAEGSDCIPAGYEPVALVEALNGPMAAARDTAGSPLMSRVTSGQQRSRGGGLKRRPSSVSDRSSRDSPPAVSSAAVPPEVRRRVLEERGRAELEQGLPDGAAAVGHRSRTPSREKGKQEDAAADDSEECERRSLLESPPPPPPSPPPPSTAVEPLGPLGPLGRRASSDSDDSTARNSRLVTVIPIEHETHMQLEDYQDTEDEIIEDQCRPGLVPPRNTAESNSSASGGQRGNYQVAPGASRPAEVRLLTSESPASRSSRGSLSSGGSTRLLIPSRQTEM